MTSIFADTSYWIALLNPRDALHNKALSVSTKFSATRIITSEMVLVELLNSFSEGDSRSRRAAARLAEILRATARVNVVRQTPEQFEAALQGYKRADDKNWSITDCASFQIMERERIRSAFTHDRHFSQAGYEALLR
jgi:predicted nucleic acid-binding protein